MKKLILLLRSGDFLTRERAGLWAAALILGWIVCIAYLGVTARGSMDYAGRPLGTDFSNVYAAGVAAAHGDPTAPFDAYRQFLAERSLFGTGTTFYGWHYPPFFLLVAAALAQFPYVVALILWQGVSLLFYLGAIRLLLRKSAMPSLAQDRLWLPLALGFTAVFVNLIHGQNGFLTTALFAAGLALLDERPLAAGMLFGLLCYKPQFAVVIPLVLAITGRWRSQAAAACMVLALAAGVTALFGWQVWPAFVASTHFTRTVILEDGNTGFNKIQSVFAWVRMWGGDVPTAYGIQAVASLLVIFAMLQIWRSEIGMGYKKAALCFAGLLITPYSLDYDLMLIAPAIALLTAEGLKRGFAPYEILVLTVLWCAPAAARTIAHTIFIPVMVPALICSFGLIWLRRNAPGRKKASQDFAKVASW
jgi:hypothetical protein